MKFSYTIIDHDPDTISVISEAMEEYPDFELVGTASTENEAVDLILSKSPNLNFIDLEIPNKYKCSSAFGTFCELRKFMSELPAFVVVTSSEKYAVEAIKNDVLDYILKPVSSMELRKALCRFERKYHDCVDTLCIRSYGDYRFVNTSDILYLKADNNTTDFHMIGGRKISAYKTLKHFEKKLPESFVRVHNSYIVNTKHVARIHFGKAKFAINEVSQWIPFSKSYKTNVETIKNSLFGANAIFM